MKLWLNETDFNKIRGTFANSSDEAEYRLRANAIAELTPPEYDLDESDAFELWQRIVADNIASISFAARYFENDEKYLAAAKKWVIAASGYPCCGRDVPDLAMGHMLFGIGLFYGWFADKLSSDERQTVKTALVRYCEEMYTAAIRTGYWKDWNLQNHMWINLCGLGTAAIALMGEYDEAEKWYELAVSRYKDVMNALGDDGASHEGVMYWGYGVSWLMRFMDIIRTYSGIDLYQNNQWFSKTAMYRLYMSLPQNAQSASENILDFADSARADGASSAFILYKLAAEYQDGYAQYLADEMSKSGLYTCDDIWLKLVWHKDVPTKDYAALPPFRHFEDMGFAILRSDWSGNESIVALKCAPPLGHSVTMVSGNDGDAGHVHPDCNHVSIFDQEFILRDDGYVWKETHSHNTLLVDGEGQEGGDCQWFQVNALIERGANPHMIKVTDTEIIADAAEAYYPHLGVEKFIRSVKFIKPNAVVVEDDIKVDRERQLELRFFPEAREYFEIEKGKYLFAGKNRNIIIKNFDGAVEEKEIFVDRWKRKEKRNAFIVAKNAAEWKTKTVVAWSGKNELPDVGANNVRSIAPSTANAASLQPDLLQIEISGKFLPGFDNRIKEYTYDTRNDPKIIGSKVTLYGVPNQAGAGTAVTIPPQCGNPYGTYKIICGENEYSVTIIGEEIKAEKLSVKNITASYYTPNSLPSLAIDGNPATYWAAEGHGISLCLDLGKTQCVSGFELALFKGDVRVSFFEVYLDDVSKGKFESSGKTQLPEYYAIKGQGRHLKILFNGNTQGNWNSVVSVGVYTTENNAV